MLAMRLERDVLQQDQLIIAAHFLELARQVLGRILAVTLAIFLPRPRHPRRGIEQALALWVVA